MKNILLLLILLSTVSSCIETNPAADMEVIGLKPTYVSYDLELIENLPSQEFEQLGNIVLYQSYIYMVEQFTGVHILDNTDPSNPINLGFINIPGVTQITIDEDVLFANFGEDLLLLDITNPLEISIKNIVSGFYELDSGNLSPQDYFGSFECPDPTKGIIVDWVETTIFDPQCWR